MDVIDFARERLNVVGGWASDGWFLVAMVDEKEVSPENLLRMKTFYPQ